MLGMHLPGLAPERSRSSMELFEREVAPQLKAISTSWSRKISTDRHHTELKPVERAVD